MFGRPVLLLGAACAVAGLLTTTPAAAAPPAAPSTAPSTSGAVAATDWARVALPAGIALPAELFGVSAPDATHAWAVGTEAGAPLIVRRLGRHWSKVPLPGITWRGELRRVAAVSRRDVWAAGTDQFGVARLLHWNGRSWRETAIPGAGDPSLAIYTMAGSPGHRPWLLVASAEGKYLLHRTARGWSRVALPPAPFETVTLNVSPTGRLWLAGLETAADGFSPLLRLYRWSRGELRRVETPDTSPAVYPNDVVPGPTGVWIGGSHEDATAATVSWDGTAWREDAFAQPTYGAVSVTADARGRPAWALHGSVNGWSTPVYLKYVRGTWVAMPGAPAAAGETGPAAINGFTAVPRTRCSLAVGQVTLTTGGYAPRIEQECA